TAHRFPAGLAGIIPTNGAVMGDIEKAAKTYRKAEILPIQRMFTAAVEQESDVPPHLYLNFLKDSELEGD
ncbi:phage portal protein, partial [Salmonella enterica]